MYIIGLFLFALSGCRGQSLEEVCGVSKYPDAGRVPVDGGRSRRIVGGTEARENEYPWMVMMDWFNGNVWDQNCGAVLINNRWALSARHCTYAADPVTDYRIVVKNHWRLPSNDGVEYTPEVIVRHPDYDSNTYENDIVMFKFPQNLTFDEDLRPICLAPRNDNDTYVGQTMILAGWGNEERNAPSPEQLLYTDLQVIAQDPCEDDIAPRPLFRDREYCVQGDLKDSGDGDSGGPYFFRRPADGRFQLLGLQSWGYWPAGTRPSIVVNVSAFYDWIEEVMRNN
ncbi:unnamed protein product [Owenia fusiformis]|uniref:Uncharacterized protein n=1 Tax=Owenia fusiformis TaxID=6347 RepID=A0A8J1TUR7_OWEFU|nr:unnamed protein product [Owenia fusiformis]